MSNDMTARPMAEEERAEMLADRIISKTHMDASLQMSPSEIAEVARALLSTSSSLRVMREALEPFAKLAAHERLHERLVDGYFPVNVGVMNGNVTQSVIRDQLTVADFRRAAAALSGIEPVDEQTRPSASAPASTRKTWKQTVADERKRLGRDMTLEELIDLARPYRMTDAEIEAQRQSWTRQDMD